MLKNSSVLYIAIQLMSLITALKKKKEEEEEVKKLIKH